MSRLHDSPQPRDVTAMTPIGTSLGNNASPRSDAACGERPSAIRSYTNLERTCLMISSPIPVTETAPRGPAYSPAPTIGESPTRPGSMNARPPVDEPVAKRPRRSRATAPTVSWRATPFHFRAYRGSRPLRIFSKLSSRCRRDSGVEGSYRAWHFDRANAIASATTRRIWGVLRTSYATRIGLFISYIAATEPAWL